MTCGNKKRILFVMQSLYDGGAEKLLVDMLNNFDYSKYDIDLLLEHDFGNYANLVPLEVRKIILFYNINRPLLERMIGKIMSYFGLYYFYILFFRRQIIIDKMKGEKYDTIISFLEGRSLVYHSFILKQGIRHLSWVHVDLFNFHWTKRYFKSNKHEKKCYELMDDVIFVSNDAKNKFQQLFNVTTSTKVIYNLIDCKTIVLRANEFKVEKRKFTVCLVGRLVRQKQFDSIIRVARIFVDNGYDIDFWIVGAGCLESDLSKMIHDLHLDDNVHLLGYKPNPYVYIKCADLFVSCSLAEGFSLVVAEALCLGKAIVSTKTVGPVELLGSNSEYGVLADNDDESLYNAIKLFVNDYNKVFVYQNKSAKRSLMFDVEKTMNEIYSIL